MPKNKPQRIIIDTNLWISFLITKRLNSLEELFLKKKMILLFSEDLFDEIKASAAKPKLQKYFSSYDVEEMLAIFENHIEIIQVTSIVEVCRDPKDDFLLALASDGNANFLLTGDKDLLSLEKYNKTRIISIADFIDLIS